MKRTEEINKNKYAYQLISLITLRKTPVHPLGSTMIQFTETCQLFSSAWLLLMCLHHAVSWWSSSHTKNIFPQRCARFRSCFSLTLNFAEVSCQRGLQEAMMAEETGRSTGMSLKMWEHANTKGSGLACLSAKSGYFRVTWVSSRDSVKCRKLEILHTCLFSTP